MEIVNYKVGSTFVGLLIYNGVSVYYEIYKNKWTRVIIDKSIKIFLPFD